MRGRDIGRYTCNYANLWLIATFPSKNYEINDYPAVKNYLLSFGKERLEQTGNTFILNGEKVQSRKKTHNKWYETQDSISYWDDFSKQKIVWKRIGSKIRFCYDDSGLFCLDSTCFATGVHIQYLAALLNTYVGNFLFKDSPKTGTGDLLISVQAFDPIRVPIPTQEQEQTIIELLDKLLLCADAETCKAFDEKLSDYVAKLYGFNEEEKAYIKAYVEKYYR